MKASIGTIDVVVLRAESNPTYSTTLEATLLEKPLAAIDAGNKSKSEKHPPSKNGVKEQSDKGSLSGALVGLFDGAADNLDRTFTFPRQSGYDGHHSPYHKHHRARHIDRHHRHSSELSSRSDITDFADYQRWKNAQRVSHQNSMTREDLVDAVAEALNRQSIRSTQSVQNSKLRSSKKVSYSQMQDAASDAGGHYWQGQQLARSPPKADPPSRSQMPDPSRHGRWADNRSRRSKGNAGWDIPAQGGGWDSHETAPAWDNRSDRNSQQGSQQMKSGNSGWEANKRNSNGGWQEKDHQDESWGGQEQGGWNTQPNEEGHSRKGSKQTNSKNANEWEHVGDRPSETGGQGWESGQNAANDADWGMVGASQQVPAESADMGGEDKMNDNTTDWNIGRTDWSKADGQKESVDNWASANNDKAAATAEDAWEQANNVSTALAGDGDWAINDTKTGHGWNADAIETPKDNKVAGENVNEPRHKAPNKEMESQSQGGGSRSSQKAQTQKNKLYVPDLFNQSPYEESPGKKRHRGRADFAIQFGTADHFVVPEDCFAVQHGHADSYTRSGDFAEYTHKTKRAMYRDSTQKPYAHFQFVYRTKAAMEKILPGISFDDKESEEDMRKRFGRMSKKELERELLKVKGMLGDEDSEGSEGGSDHHRGIAG